MLFNWRRDTYPAGGQRTRYEQIYKQRKMRAQFERNWLLREYVARERTCEDIAQELGCHRSTVSRALSRARITARGIQELPPLDPSEPLDEILEGLVLGDGYVSDVKNHKAQVEVASMHEGFVLWLGYILEDLGLRCYRIYRLKRERPLPQGGVTDTPIFFLKTYLYKHLVEIRQWFYPEGTKIVPPDVSLTPLSCLHWYLGDGCLKRSRSSFAIDMSTCGFTVSDVELLVEKLRAIGFQCTRQPSTNTIRISAYSAHDFLDYIGPCPRRIDHIFGYKWAISPRRPPHRRAGDRLADQGEVS